MAASDTPDVPPIPVPPIEPAPKAKAAPTKPATTNPAAAKGSTAAPTSAPAPSPVADRPNPYAQVAPAAPQPYMNGPYVAPPSQGLSITSMVLGIVGLAFSFCYGGGLLFSLGAVITGHLAAKREPHAKNFRLAGIITGYVGLGISALVILGIIAYFIFLAVVTASAVATSGY